jgi:DNA-binding MarR family transcriptional regulator
MSDRPSPTTIRAWARLATAQQLALSSIERALKQAGFPPLTWYDVLLELDRADGHALRPFELERAMLLAQYNLSRLVDRLERAGYVERRACEEDGRGQEIVATAKGLALRRRMWPTYARAIEAAVGRHLSPRQAETLQDLLGRLIDGHRNAP